MRKYEVEVESGELKLFSSQSRIGIVELKLSIQLRRSTSNYSEVWKIVVTLNGLHGENAQSGGKKSVEKRFFSRSHDAQSENTKSPHILTSALQPLANFHPLP